MKAMRPYLLVPGLAVTLLASGLGAAKSTSQIKQLKILQKAARKRLKLQERAWKRSFHGRPIPRADQLVARHQYQLYRRNLRSQQRAELKQLKRQLSLGRAVRNAGQ